MAFTAEKQMMTVYRLAYRDYVMDLKGVGAQLYGGRWNPKGLACLYASERISLALLEKFVHAQGKESMNGLALLQIDIPDQEGWIYHMDASRLMQDWSTNFDYSQWLGEQVLNDLSFVAFSVPSAIVPSERNVVINPQAVHFDNLVFSDPVPYRVDFRLLDKL